MPTPRKTPPEWKRKDGVQAHHQGEPLEIPKLDKYRRDRVLSKAREISRIVGSGSPDPIDRKIQSANSKRLLDSGIREKNPYNRFMNQLYSGYQDFSPYDSHEKSMMEGAIAERHASRMLSGKAGKGETRRVVTARAIGILPKPIRRE